MSYFGSVYEEFIHLNEAVHVFIKDDITRLVDDIIIHKILKIPTINVDKKTERIILSDNIEDSIKSTPYQYKIDTNYCYNAKDRKRMEILNYDDLVLFKRATRHKDLVKFAVIQPKGIDYLHLTAEDYKKINIYHPIYVQLYYGDVVFIGSVSRGDLTDETTYSKMSDDEKRVYIEKLMSDPVIISIDLKKNKTLDQLRSTITHEAAHMFMLCDPKRRTVSEVDFDNYESIKQHVDSFGNVLRTHIHRYNMIMYFLVKDECASRINAISGILLNNIGFYKKYIKEHKELLKNDIICYIYEDLKKRLRKGLIENNNIDRILYYSHIKNPLLSIQKKFHNPKEVKEELQYCMGFKLVLALKKNLLKNLSSDDVYYYINLVTDNKSSIGQINKANEVLHIVDDRISKLYNQYINYLWKIKVHLTYYYDNYLINNTVEPEKFKL